MKEKAADLRGFRYDSNGICPRCSELVEWWYSPSGLKVPFTVIKSRDYVTGEVNEDRHVNHLTLCSYARELRKKKKGE